MDPIREAVRDIATRIVSGHLAPVDGAGQIAAYVSRLEDPGELAVFADLARTSNETGILEEASLLLADTA
jgi:anthranilate phosphoribosyltransferase